MDWTQIIGQFQGQGSIFWVAAMSIAAGATLLLASGVVLAKRGLVKSLFGSQKPSGNLKIPPNPSSSGANQVQLTETGYTAQTLAMNPGSNPQSPLNGDKLGELHSRLRQAANALEDMHQILKNDPQLNGISRLKAPLRDVEYVFKTGLG